jgi:hypothetical protein
MNLRLSVSIFYNFTCYNLFDEIMIGITEHWNASIHLFHAIHGGNVYPEEFQIFRPSNYEYGTSKYKGEIISAKQILQQSHYRDEYDEEIYSYALELYYERLYQYQPHLFSELVRQASALGGGKDATTTTTASMSASAMKILQQKAMKKTMLRMKH